MAEETALCINRRLIFAYELDHEGDLKLVLSN